MRTKDSTGPDVLLDARGRSRVAPPLMPEFAIVSTMVLIAAPIALVGSAMLMALALKVRGLTLRR